MKARRVAFVGLDGTIPWMAEKFMAEGIMPNLVRLTENGFTTESVPSLPTWTPGNWTTIVTGAQTSTHGIEGFEIHMPGEPLPYKVYHRGFDQDLRKAETIWEAGAKVGKKAIIVKYPVTFPVFLKEEEGIQVGGSAGFGGLRSYLDVWHGHCFTNEPAVRHATPVSIRPAADWKNAPVPLAEALECDLNIHLNRHRGRIAFYGLIYRSQLGGAFDRFLMASSKDGRDCLADLGLSQWSDWITGVFDKQKAPEEGGFRCKLIDLAPDGTRVKLFMTQNHPLHGYTVPASIAEEITALAGPFPEFTAMEPALYGWFDHQTQMEIYKVHTDWLIKVAQHLLAHHDWDIFVTQHHPIDYAEHYYYGFIDPKHPEYDPANEAVGWEGLRCAYHEADRYLGAVMDAVGEDTVVVMSGDHGTDSSHYTFRFNNILEREGLLKVRVGDDGQYEPIWSETKAYSFQSNIVYVNLKGRDPEGIVEPGPEYEALREHIIRLLYEARCEETGVHPVAAAMKVEDADYFGLYGGGIGDVIYVTHVGYDSGVTERLGKSDMRAGVTPDRGACIRNKIGSDMTGDHCSFPNWAKNLRTLTVFCGPGVRKNVRRRTPIRLIDVAPMMSYLIGIPYPAQTEGSIVLDALEENENIR